MAIRHLSLFCIRNSFLIRFDLLDAIFGFVYLFGTGTGKNSLRLV